MNKFILSALFILLSATAMADSDVRSIRAEVNGLVCAFCAQGITRALSRESAAAEVFVSLQDRLVAVELHDGQELTDERFNKILSDAGYDVVKIERVAQNLASIRAEFGREP